MLSRSIVWDKTLIDRLEAKLEWNPKVLNVVNIAQGDFLKTDEPASWIVGVNETEGWISVTYYLLSGAQGIGANGSGTLAKITFHAADAGECILHLYDTKIFKPVSVASPPNLGDVNSDLKVDMKDTGDVDRAWGSSKGELRYNPNADFNEDGFIDLFDLLCAIFNFGHIYAETDTARQPMEITHQVQDGSVLVYPVVEFSVTWKWLNYTADGYIPIWLTANITYIAGSPLENFSFNRTL
jgi:hypothetical protein